MPHWLHNISMCLCVQWCGCLAETIPSCSTQLLRSPGCRLRSPSSIMKQNQRAGSLSNRQRKIRSSADSPSGSIQQPGLCWGAPRKSTCRTSASRVTAPLLRHSKEPHPRSLTAISWGLLSSHPTPSCKSQTGLETQCSWMHWFFPGYLNEI